jgi:hypothetical protein
VIEPWIYAGILLILLVVRLPFVKKTIRTVRI